DLDEARAQRDALLPRDSLELRRARTIGHRLGERGKLAPAQRLEEGVSGDRALVKAHELGAPIDRSARKRGDPLEVLLLVGVRRLELGDGNAKVAHGMLSTRVAVRSITPDRNVREDGA